MSESPAATTFSHSIPSREPTLAELVERARKGSVAAQREVIEKYGSHVLRVVRRNLNQRLRPRFDSVDFVQDVWVSFFRTVGSEHILESPNDLATFLITIARNKVVDANRQQLDTERCDLRREESLDQRKTKSDRPGAMDMPARQPTPSQVAMAQEAWHNLVDGLPEHYRNILALRQEGYQHEEIASRLNLNERTVRRVIERLNPYERDPAA